jgi:DNA-binding LacI/PurR family transcriptional regulator
LGEDSVNGVNGRRPATMVVIHEHAGVLELIETALRERGARVLATLASSEALEIVRELKVDVLLLSRAQTAVAREARELQPGLPIVVLGDEPVSLAEIEIAAFAALARQEERA